MHTGISTTYIRKEIFAKIFAEIPQFSKKNIFAKLQKLKFSYQPWWELNSNILAKLLVFVKMSRTFSRKRKFSRRRNFSNFAKIIPFSNDFRVFAKIEKYIFVSALTETYATVGNVAKLHHFWPLRQ
jgi:hypothetical protein